MLGNLRDFPKMHLIQEQLTKMRAWRDVCRSLSCGTILLQCCMPKGPMVERGHLRSLIFRPWEPSACSVLLTPTAADIQWFIKCPQMALKIWKEKKNTLCNLEIPSEQQLSFKPNLWCYDLYMIHQQEKLSVTHLQLNNQALIWDLITGSQHAVLTKKMRNQLF